MNPVWTITYLGTEQSAAQWGLTAKPVMRTRDRSPTEFRFRMAGAPPEGTIPFPFKAQVIIRQNRIGSGTSWAYPTGGSGYVFTGYQTTQPADVDGHSQGITLVFKDALWLLQNTVFQQLWTIASTPGSPDWISRAVLFMDINSWAPNIYQSVQWQIQQIISYAANQCGIAIAAGTIDYSGWFLNYYHCRAISCWEALLKCLEPIPDAKVWIDGSTTPPQLNVRTRSALSALPAPTGTAPGPITLPYKGADASGRHHFSTQGFTPRYDLIPPQVVLQYQINNTYNGKPAPYWTTDAYPLGSAGTAPFAMVCPIDLTGAALTTETGTLDCEPLACVGGSHAAKRAWWASKRGGEQDKLQDYRVRFGANTLADATVVDDNGNPINLATYPNRIVQGTYHAWMKNGSTSIVAIRAHIKVAAQFTEYDVAGSTPAETDTNGNSTRTAYAHDLHCHVTLTNAPDGVTTFVGENLTAYAESPVAGLAQNIHASRATLDYDGAHEIIDPGLKNGAGGSGTTQPVQQLIGHWNVLNFSGGATAWATANMTIAGTEIDLQSNHIRIEVGPSKHLQPQDWSSMLQFFRYRRLYQDSAVRATGLGGSNNNVDMALNTPDANTVPGLHVDQQLAHIAPDAIASGLTNVLTHDATTGQIQRQQQYGGSTITTGYIAPAYAGAGAPSATTLPANAYYRLFDRYVDSTTSPRTEYLCTTAGNNSTSTWAQIGGTGGGGGVQQFQLAANGGVVDGGDFWWAKAWDGTTLSGTFTKIAKQYKQRCVNGPTSDSIGGVSYNYTYALDGSYPRYIRTTSISGGPFSGSTTTDYIEPQGLAGDVIYAIPFSTASPGTLSAVTLIEIGPMRDWITYPS